MSIHPDSYVESLHLYIDGQWCGCEGRESRPVVNPATEEVIGSLPIASDADIDRALAAAERGFGTWSKKSAWERAVVLKRAAAPIADSMGEIDRSVETIEWCAEEAKRTYGRVSPPRSPGLSHSTFKRPIGPVAAFAPWNFPAVLMTRKLAAALAAGCSIVIKPAEETPAVCMGIVRAFVDAGLPPGVLNLLFGVPSQISERLIASPIIRKVSFTGSVPVGRHLSKLAADGLKAVTMELGGHSPVVVFDDVDVDKVAASCAGFKFRNAGQVCLAPNRMFVHEAVYEQFVRRFVEVGQQLKVGNGLESGIQMGPLSNSRRLDATAQFVEDAIAHGGRVVHGGKRIGKKGYFFEPTVLQGVSSEASIMTEEPFCPVVPIIPFSTFDEAVQKANAVDFGLAAYAFTASLKNASAIAEAFDAGWLGINSFTPALADVPLGGTKFSGVGYEGGPEGLDAYLQTKFLAIADPQ
jgi:succinate-semialdehyde dehydrogenase / glutarate-semialdehyde dehydrogenase